MQADIVENNGSTSLKVVRLLHPWKSAAMKPEYQQYGMTSRDIWTFDGWKVDLKVAVFSAESLLSKGCFHVHGSLSSSEDSFLAASFRVHRRTCQ